MTIFPCFFSKPRVRFPLVFIREPDLARRIESVTKKPKKKKRKKLLPDEEWLDQQEYFQDQFDSKEKVDKRFEAEKKREPWIWKETFFQDQFEKDEKEKTSKKKTSKKRKKSRKKKRKKDQFY